MGSRIYLDLISSPPVGWIESPFSLLMFDMVGCFHLKDPNPLSSVESAGIESMAAAVLRVTDELVLPLRAVGDLVAAVGVLWEEAVVIMQYASLDELSNIFPRACTHRVRNLPSDAS